MRTVGEQIKEYEVGCREEKVERCRIVWSSEGGQVVELSAELKYCRDWNAVAVGATNALFRSDAELTRSVEAIGRFVQGSGSRSCSS